MKRNMTFLKLKKLCVLCLVKTDTMVVPLTNNVFDNRKLYYFCVIFPFGIKKFLQIGQNIQQKRKYLSVAIADTDGKSKSIQ